MTDTHTHLYMPVAYEDGGVQAVADAIEAGVRRMVFPCVNLDSLPDMERLHARYPDNTALGLGLHPTDLGTDWRETLSRMESMLPGGFVAIGEVGIDHYHDDPDADAAQLRRDQMEAFALQLGWAQKHHLPVIIHCREGLEDTLTVIQAVEGELPPLIFHSFTGTAEDVRRIREVCDPWFGINGVVTFKNAPLLREALPEIGLEKMLLETDAPWLSPAPKRGQRNESSRIPYIRDCIASTLGLSPEEVERVTDTNATELFFNAI